MYQSECSLIAVEQNEDIVKVRTCVRDAAAAMGFSHIDQVRLVTAASELARNIRLYAGKGAWR